MKKGHSPPKDPTLAIRKYAAEFPDVEQGTSCTQSSFKSSKSAFLYIGEQGGRFKAMFKLSSSLDAAKKLAEESPDDFQVGSTSWVTARFSSASPLPKKIWKKWLDESYQLSLGGTKTKKSSVKNSRPKTPIKKVKKKAGKKKTSTRKSAKSRP